MAFPANRTFGVEIECYLPSGRTHAQLAAHIAANANVRARSSRYTHDATPYWKVTTDGSLGSYESGAEIVSPVLRGAEGLEQVARVARAIESFGATVKVDCGLHVHVGAADLSLDQVKRVAINFFHFEHFFDYVMPPSRRADLNQFVHSNRRVYGSYGPQAVNAAITAIRAVPNFRDLLWAVSNGSRYFKLNVMPLVGGEGRDAQGTIEFRQHNGTVDAAKITNWINLVVSFVEASRTSRPRNRTVESNPSPAADMALFFRMFNIDKDVADFYRARRKALWTVIDSRAAARRNESELATEIANLRALNPRAHDLDIQRSAERAVQTRHAARLAALA